MQLRDTSNNCTCVLGYPLLSKLNDNAKLTYTTNKKATFFTLT